MIKIKIENEYSQLKTVILGIANDIGEAPSIFDTYDPRSLYHVKNNTFPNETSLVKNVESFYNKLFKHFWVIKANDLFFKLRFYFYHKVIA